MRKNSWLRSPKTEEQEVPNNYDDKGFETLDDLEGFLGINSDVNVEEDDEVPHHKHEENEFWDFVNLSWEEESPSNGDQIGWEDQKESCSKVSSGSTTNSVRNEEFSGYFGFSNEVIDETKRSLNLSLNYEEVLEAWSNRGSLWTDHHRQHPSFSISNSNYMGEVPNLEDERTRRETSVLRYKEKRQNRLFSKKIRYEVRKLNADKRPRLKGRFVKRTPDSKMSKAAG